jgi:5-methylcytosine-specific restriction protein A
VTRRTGPTLKVRDLVFQRDGSACVVCRDTYQLQVHHRRPRGAGGTQRPESNEAANLVVVCLTHHSWLESQRELARQRGYLVPQHANPEDVPIVWCGVHVYLRADGSVEPVDEGAA